MDNNISKRLALLLNKMPKKNLDKNLQKAKEILSNCSKDDLNNFLNSKPVSDMLGKDKDKIVNAVKNKEINLENLKNINSNNIWFLGMSRTPSHTSERGVFDGWWQ